MVDMQVLFLRIVPVVNHQSFTTFSEHRKLHHTIIYHWDPLRILKEVYHIPPFGAEDFNSELVSKSKEGRPVSSTRIRQQLLGTWQRFVHWFGSGISLEPWWKWMLYSSEKWEKTIQHTKTLVRISASGEVVVANHNFTFNCLYKLLKPPASPLMTPYFFATFFICGVWRG